MKIYNKIFAVLLGASVFAACEEPELPTPAPSITVGQAKLAIFNLWTSSANVDMFVDNEVASYGQNVAYMQRFGIAPYQTVPSGLRLLEFDTTGKKTPSVQSQASYLSSTAYSLFLTGISGSTAFLSVTDNLAAPAAGKAHVRFLQLSSNADTAEVVDTATIATNIFPSRTFREVTRGSGTSAQNFASFKAIDAGEVRWRIRQVTKKSSTKAGYPLDVTETLADGKIYTIILRGRSGGSAGQELGYTVIQHN
jgi:hypothetical protein